jgi:uncharacterized iron-regulated protein
LAVRFAASRALLAPTLLSVLASCNARSTLDDGASPPLADVAPELRTREGRAVQLLALTREVAAKQPTPGFDQLALTARPTAAAAFAALEPDPAAPDPQASDAGAPDAGAEPIEPTMDAGAAAPPPPPPPPPPPGLPRDIVEQSALPIYGLEAGVRLTESELWDRLAQSPAVCFGEYHDVPAHHYAETRALDELAARAESCGHRFAVGYEMFQRPYQAPLSAFVAGELGEADFLAQTEYATRWGYDFALYRPLLERTRDQHLPALALNMQREITRKIGRTGLESLTEEERALLPELVLDDPEHRTFIFGLFGVLPEHAEELGLENIYVAQTVWDETMADTSARWLTSTRSSKGRRGSPARLLDFAGGVHCHQSAIPRRITRRTGEPVLSVHAVFESELADGSFTPEGYDVLVVLDD